MTNELRKKDYFTKKDVFFPFICSSFQTLDPVKQFLTHKVLLEKKKSG